MSVDKKRVRQAFRSAVFARDCYCCRVCAVPAGKFVLDAHHITDRGLMPNGGYVEENGISLCPGCHRKAEVFHETGTALDGWAPNDLYERLGLTYERAHVAASRLK